MNVERHILGPVEFPRPLKRGDSVSVRGTWRLVLEVQRLASTMNIAWEERRVYVVLHERGEKELELPVMMVIDLSGQQRTWVLTAEEKQRFDAERKAKGG